MRSGLYVTAFIFLISMHDERYCITGEIPQSYHILQIRFLVSNEVSELLHMENRVVLVYLHFDSSVFTINKATHAVLVPFVFNVAVLVVEEE